MSCLLFAQKVCDLGHHLIFDSTKSTPNNYSYLAHFPPHQRNTTTTTSALKLTSPSKASNSMLTQHAHPSLSPQSPPFHKIQACPQLLIRAAIQSHTAPRPPRDTQHHLSFSFSFLSLSLLPPRDNPPLAYPRCTANTNLLLTVAERERSKDSANAIASGMPFATQPQPQRLSICNRFVSFGLFCFCSTLPYAYRALEFNRRCVTEYCITFGAEKRSLRMPRSYSDRLMVRFLWVGGKLLVRGRRKGSCFAWMGGVLA